MLICLLFIPVYIAMFLNFMYLCCKTWKRLGWLSFLRNRMQIRMKTPISTQSSCESVRVNTSVWFSLNHFPLFIFLVFKTSPWLAKNQGGEPNLGPKVGKEIYKNLIFIKMANICLIKIWFFKVLPISLRVATWFDPAEVL